MYKLLEVPISRALLLLDLSYDSIRKIHSQGLVVICLYSELFWEILIPKALTGNIQWHLFNIAVVWGCDTWWYKQEQEQNLKGRAGKWDVPRGSFEKLWHFPGYLESQTCAGLYVRPGKTWVGPSLSPWLNLKPFTKKKWKLMQGCKLPKDANMPNAQIPCVKDGRFVSSIHWKKSLAIISWQLNSDFNTDIL